MDIVHLAFMTSHFLVFLPVSLTVFRSLPGSYLPSSLSTLTPHQTLNSIYRQFTNAHLQVRWLSWAAEFTRAYVISPPGYLHGPSQTRCEFLVFPSPDLWHRSTCSRPHPSSCGSQDFGHLIFFFLSQSAVIRSGNHLGSAIKIYSEFPPSPLSPPSPSHHLKCKSDHGLHLLNTFQWIPS